MTSYSLARPVPGNRIVPFGQERLASDVLPNGRPAFRVTQRFNDVNPAFPQNGPHRATDLGNWFCGDQVYAVYGGLAKTIGPDQYGALGIIIDHGSFQSVYWHLNGFTIPRGDAVPVKWGQQIGIVGKTGLGAVCHVHFEIKIAGTRIDPEPYLLGAPLVLEDSDVFLPADGKHLVQAKAMPKTRLRVDPDTPEGARMTQDKIEFVRVYEVGIKGQPYTIGGKASDLFALVGYGGETGYAAQGALFDYELTTSGKDAVPVPTVVKEVPGDCSVQDAKLEKVRNAVVALRGANQNESVAIEALGKVVGP